MSNFEESTRNLLDDLLKKGLKNSLDFKVYSEVLKFIEIEKRRGSFKIDFRILDFIGVDYFKDNKPNEPLEGLIENLKSIKGVDCGYGVKKSLIEFKEVVTHIFINIDFSLIKDVTFWGIIAKCIYDYFKKDKTKNEKPIIINYNHIQIIQGKDSQKEIEDKLKKMWEVKKIENEKIT